MEVAVGDLIASNVRGLVLRNKKNTRRLLKSCMGATNALVQKFPPFYCLMCHPVFFFSFSLSAVPALTQSIVHLLHLSQLPALAKRPWKKNRCVQEVHMSPQMDLYC